MKHFALCLNDKYVPYACVTIQSILMHHRKENVTFHLVTDGFTEKSTQLLCRLVGGANLNIYQVTDDTKLDGLNMAWSKYTWYRVYLPELLPKSVGRVLYLDCDVCVTDQLDELFDMDMEEKAIAGVLDPESYSDSVYDRLGYSSDKKYICAGVLMMNIHYWRKADISEKVLDYGKTYPEKTLFPDQDAINVICQDVKVILSPKYSPFLRIAKFFEKEEWNEYISHPAIIHYAGCAPWKGNPNNHPFHYYWWKAFNAMPFNFWNVRYGFWKCQMKFLIKKWLHRL